MFRVWNDPESLKSHQIVRFIHFNLQLPKNSTKSIDSTVKTLGVSLEYLIFTKGLREAENL